MKRFLVVLIVLILMIAGLTMLLRRRHIGPPPDDARVLFQSNPVGAGILMQYLDAQTPLRSIRWLPPSKGGHQVVQIITQTDRQQIALFSGGVFKGCYLVPKPFGVRDGFFRFAKLGGALVFPSDVVVLLYHADDSASDELPLVMALDLKTQDTRWIHRAKGDRIIGTPDDKEAVYLFSPKDPIVRLPLELQRGELSAKNGIRPSAIAIELPTEIQEVGDLLPTTAWTFLVAHRGGLSIYFGVKGWNHIPLDGDIPPYFQHMTPVLVKAKRIWWQPYPGRVIQLQADGTPSREWTYEQLEPADPNEKDGMLLHLVGSDSTGQLWFDLSRPEAIPPIPTSHMDEGSGTTSEGQVLSEPTPAMESPLTGLTEYVTQGLERLYQWDPDKNTLRRVNWAETWPALHAPPEIQKPSASQFLWPEAGCLFIESGTKGWTVPLGALSLSGPATTGKPITYPK